MEKLNDMPTEHMQCLTHELMYVMLSAPDQVEVVNSKTNSREHVVTLRVTIKLNVHGGTLLNQNEGKNLPHGATLNHFNKSMDDEIMRVELMKNRV